MKVTTDACLLGAWFAEKNLGANEILDIGSGTGLLLLMMAQKHQSNFSGIEIDPSCFKQLSENVNNSKWKHRIHVIEGDVRNLSADKKFDFIISNPPFYENSLSSPLATSNLARHSSHLNLEELLACIHRNLSAKGSFGVLLPHYRTSEFETLARENGFHLVEKSLVKQSVNHNYFRSILYYSRNQIGECSQNELVIQNESGAYTNEFIQLLKDYYLYLETQ